MRVGVLGFVICMRMSCEKVEYAGIFCETSGVE